MVREFFLKCELGFTYSYMYYDYDSFQVIMDELEGENQVPLSEHDIFYKVKQNLIYTYEDGRVVVFMGGSLLLFEPKSYSVWLNIDGALERAVNTFPQIEVQSGLLGSFKPYKISNFVAEIILELANKVADLQQEMKVVYKTPHGWVIIQDYESEENYFLFEEDANRLLTEIV